MLSFVEILNFISTLYAFIYGAHVSFKEKGILFLQILTCAFGCFLLGNLYNLSYFLCLNDKNHDFSIGDIAHIGGLLFLFSSYYGALNRIGDNGTKFFFKYRLISFVVSLINISIVTILIIILNINVQNISVYISNIILTVIIYFSFKNFILPDIDNGILKSLRLYNFLIFIFCITKIFYCIFLIKNLNFALYLNLIISLITIFLLPIAHKGVKKWYI